MKRKGILQLVEQFKADAREDKINLAIGIYMDKQRNAPIFEVVRDVERNLAEEEQTKAQFNMLGTDQYRNAVKCLLYPEFSNEERNEIFLMQTLGASGALSITSNLIASKFPNATVWFSNPTWENHEPIFSNHISSIKHYEFKTRGGEFDVESMLVSLNDAKNGDVIVLQGCCQNPTGITVNTDKWEVIAKECKLRGLLPIFDFAYQGIEYGLVEDARPLRIFKDNDLELIVCSSFSKNLGLYDERIGSLSLVFKNEAEIKVWEEDIRKVVRTSYSIPPVHGSLIASKILNDQRLYKRWESELTELREYIDFRRNLVINKMNELEITSIYLNTTSQRGMFMCLELSLEHIDHLRDKYGIYIIDTGRISIASLDETKIDYICETLKVTANFKDNE